MSKLLAIDISGSTSSQNDVELIFTEKMHNDFLREANESLREENERLREENESLKRRQQEITS